MTSIMTRWYLQGDSIYSTDEIVTPEKGILDYRFDARDSVVHRSGKIQQILAILKIKRL
jgi:hypothetical protein